MLEFMEGVGKILWHGEVNNSLLIIVPVKFNAAVKATATITSTW